MGRCRFWVHRPWVSALMSVAQLAGLPGGCGCFSAGTPNSSCDLHTLSTSPNTYTLSAYTTLFQFFPSRQLAGSPIWSFGVCRSLGPVADGRFQSSWALPACGGGGLGCGISEVPRGEPALQLTGQMGTARASPPHPHSISLHIITH